jgi:NTE family protein
MGKMTDGQRTEQKVRAPINDGKKRISIAMQGGGAHGAYTWGVLDRLLQEKDLIIEGVSGTSAGGMNAVATAQGIMKGGNEGARELLTKYWGATSDGGKSSIFKPGVKDILAGKFTMHNSPGFLFFDFLSKILSPYQMNPSGSNPLKGIIEEMFDFDLMNGNELVKIFLAATHVYTGKIKIFTNTSHDLCTESLLATACLPTLFAAVLVKGEYYWDGGFIGNPAIYPLIYECETPDIMIIKLNPTHRNKLPTSASEIGDRLNEITNNTSIVREMRSMHFITKLIDQGIVPHGKLKRCFIHLIEDEKAFHELGWSSKLNTDKDFLDYLFKAGRKSADKWLEKNWDLIGKQTTADVAEEFV